MGFGEYAIALWKRKDPSYVVIDEFAGQWVSLLPVVFLPTGWMRILGVAVAFLLFRVFDVIKPPPAGRRSRFRLGWASWRTT